MAKVMRSLGAILAGVLLGGVTVALIEAVSSWAYPPPAGVNLADPVQLRAFVATLPMGAFLFVLAAWASGTLLGSGLAARLAPVAPAGHGAAVGAVFLLASLANLLAIPHPLWFALVALPLVILAGLAGTILGRRHRPIGEGKR